MNQIHSKGSSETKEQRGTSPIQKRAQALRPSDQVEESVWLSEIQNVLSPYWAARSEFQAHHA